MAEQSTELVAGTTPQQLAISEDPNQNLLDPKRFDQLMRVAEVYASASNVPDHYKNKVNDVFIAIQMALRVNCDIYAFLQQSYVVHGKPGIEAKLAIALLDQSGRTRGPVSYQLERDGKGQAVSCVASVRDAQTNEIEYGPKLDWETVTKEGWDKNPKWHSMRELMFHYRSAMFLIRVKYPGVVLGMQSKEELDDMMTVEATSIRPTRSLDQLAAKLSPPTPLKIEEAPEQVKAAPKPKAAKKKFSKQVADIIDLFPDLEELAHALGQAKSSPEIYEAAAPFGDLANKEEAQAARDLVQLRAKQLEDAKKKAEAKQKSLI